MLVHLATRLIDLGTVRTAILAVREESRVRQQMASSTLRRTKYVSKPEAFHLWLTVPEHWSRNEFATYLRSLGVTVVVSDTFTVSGTPPEAVRVCLGGPADRDECQNSLEIIEDAIEQQPAVSFRGV